MRSENVPQELSPGEQEESSLLEMFENCLSTPVKSGKRKPFQLISENELMQQTIMNDWGKASTASPEKDVPEPSFVPGELAGAVSKLAGSQENEDPDFQPVKKRGVSAASTTAKFTPKVSAPLVTYLS
ncbi:hypothetical protein CYMTET_23132 [Cymbomonas tetramitiformis]|uniref:Uncharacterized protein n=1 Tax=Cymbomonas tetramitiformis TaxID=36881 RepID=A0AAE0FZ08_9CHLO|nr:hypothetical protein CYMTET_23132 [Cymbomonas tetramitiformis]